MYAFVAVSAVVPSLLLIWYFHSRDVYPEPKKVVLATFGLSVLSVVPVLITALPVKLLLVDKITNPWAGGAAGAFLTAAIPEEFFKFVVVFWYASRHKEFDEPMDGIVYGVVGSLGFATLENVMYSMQGGMVVAIMRAVSAVPGHAFLGAIMGYYIGQYRFPPTEDSRGNLFKALFWPIVLHGLYDWPLLSVGRIKEAELYEGDTLGYVVLALMASAVVVLLVEWVWAIKVTRRLRRDQQDQVAREAQLAKLEPKPEVSVEPAQPLVPTPAPASPMAAVPVPKEPVASSTKWTTTKGSPLGPILMTLGVLMASFGGLVVLGMGVAWANGDLDLSLEVALTTTLVIGLIPLALGVWAFVGGLNKLPKKIPPEATQ